MKKLLSILLCAMLLVSGFSFTALAVDHITVTVDNQTVNFPDQTPELKNGVTYVPVRSVFEQMGATVDYIAATNGVKISANNVDISFAFGSNTATVTSGGTTEFVKLQNASYITNNNRTMVPLRFIAETLSYDVDWDAANSTVRITSNKAKALALIGSFATGDTTIAQNLLTENYIQHNIAFGTGRDAFVAAVQGLSQAPTATTVQNVRAFTDGDYVFLHNIYNFAGAGEQVAFDVFRFENGKIAEHWDNLGTLNAPNPSGRTQTDGTTAIKDIDKTEENKGLVMNFIEDILMGKNMDALTRYYDGNNYIQHNSDIADGLDGLGTALAAWAEQGITMVYDKTYLLLGEGNFVLAASEGTLGGVKTVFYDLFRVEKGYIAEHWDVIETVPGESTWANQNGKFGKGNTTNVPLPRTYHLSVGTMQVYNFDGFKLHAYQTGDYIDNENFILETPTELIIMELAPFYANIAELESYINALGKPLTSVIVAYHPAGGDSYPDAHMYASEGLGEKGLVAGFVKAFGDIFNGNLPTEYDLVTPGSMTIGGVQFNVIKTADAFDLEIPAINVYLTHMIGSYTHNILASVGQIDATIAELKGYQAKNYALILTGHDVPRTIEVTAEKIAYLEKTKELITSCKSAAEFISEMNKAFPAYSGGNYLEMTAGIIFG